MNPSRPSARVLPALWKLLLLRLRISINSFRHTRLGRKIALVFVGLLVLGSAGFILYLSTLVLDFLRSPTLTEYAGIDPVPLLRAVPVVTLSGLFIGVMLTSFGVLLQALYLSGDMDFLLSSPVPIRAVFAMKLTQAVLPNLGLISFFGLPILIGLGISGGYNFLYYPLLILVMLALSLVAAGFSSLIVMLVARVFPARRAAEIIAFVGGTFALICSQMGNFSRTFADHQDFSNQQLSSMSSLLVRFNTPWFPLNWAGLGLVNIGEGQWLPGILFLLLTFGLCAVGFWFALATAERWYYTGWAGMQVVSLKKKPLRVSSPRAATSTRLDAGSQEDLPHWAERLIPAPVRAVITKDFLVMRRDLRNLSQLVSPLILGVIYTLMILRSGGEPPPGQGEAPDWFMETFRILLSYGSVGMALFVGWMLLGRLAGMGFSQEGRNYWMLKVSPVSPAGLLAAKYLVAYLPTLALGLFFLIVISFAQGMSVSGFLYSLLAVVLSLAGMNGIMIAFGAAGASFNWEDPRKMNAGSIGCLGQFVTMLVLPVSYGLFIAPLVVVIALEMPMIYGYLIGAALGCGVNFLCAFLPLKLAEKRVAHLGEQE